MKKNYRILSAVLAVFMLLSMIPVTALATEETEHEHTYVETVLREPTCTTTGVKKLACSCGDTKYVLIPLHNFGEGVVTTPATCGKDGVMTFTCTGGCGTTRTEAIPATGNHTFEDNMVDATCTEPAMAGEICTVCGTPKGELTVVEGSKPLGHEFVLDKSAEGYKAATCTEGGLDTFKCSRCDATKTEETKAAGHSWDEGVLVDDCEGQYVLYTCTVCNETMKELTGIGEVREHDWKETAKTEATCTETGKITYTCTVCGKEKIEEIAALGHDIVDTVVPATCKAEGYTSHVCSRGDYTGEKTNVTPIDPNGHIAGDGVVLKAPTCTVAGVMKNVCKLCGASMGYVSIAPTHTWNDGEVTKASTCTEDGVKTFTCTVCGEKKTEVIPAAHNYDAGAITKAATCGADGVKTFTCTVCGDTYTEVIPATGNHNFEESILDATCTEPAKAGEICTVCGTPKGELTVVEGSKPLGHEFVLDKSAEGYKAATCTEGGLDTFKCSRCDATKTEETKATGHSWDEGVLVDDCEGQYVLYTCTVCNETMKELTGIGEVREHNWEATAKTEATCTQAGEITYTCTICNNEKTEEIAALGHDIVDTVVPATCKAEGYTSHVCSRGDYTGENTDVTPIDPNGHVAGDGVVLKVPTCTVAGVKKNVCKLCGASMGYVSIAPAHTWDGGTITKAPTCTEDGVKTFTCTVCGEKRTEVVPAAHSYDTGVITKAATCGADGVKTFTCSECGDTYTEVIPATGNHNFQDDYILDATCTEPMKIGRLCTVCGAADGEVTEIGEPAGHTYEKNITKEPTCTEAGEATFTCSVCGDSYKEVVAATGHTWNDGEIKDADCENGQRVLYTCEKCGETKSEETGLEAALGHDIIDTVVPATCTEKGYTSHKCSRCDYEAEKTDYTEIDPAAHTFDYENAYTLREGTCAVPGVIRVTCTGCDKTVYQEKVVPHTWNEGEVTKDPSCTEAGEVTYTCTECGATKIDVIEPMGHTFGEEQVSDDNTYIYQKCTICGYEKIVASLVECEHETELRNAKDATCTEAGYTGDQVCTKCGEVIEAGEAIPALDHKTELRNAKDATCTEVGYTGDQVCTVCGEVIEAGTEIQAKGHTEVIVPGKDATCTETGLTEGKVCSDCGTVIVAQEVIPVIEHDYVQSGPIYSDDYSTYWYTYTCSHCGHSYNSDPIPA